LIGCATPDVMVPAARRLPIAVLVHLPLASETGLSPDEAAELDAREGAVLRAVAATVATSEGAAATLIERHGLDPGRVRVAPPGADPAPPAVGSVHGSRLTCVASLTPRKGQDVLVEALARIADLAFTCDCVGGPVAGPYAGRLRELAAGYRLDDRFRLAGVRTGAALSATYAATDLLVLPSRAETYGMVVTEALARGVPVLATRVDGVPEALGTAPDGSTPGLLVPPGDALALAAALRRWLDSPDLREELRRSAALRRAELPGWEVTADLLVAAFREVAR
jgi:glycosyltransferase involved in cell wall biosynthesis